MSDSSHPVWGLARFVTAMAATCVTLYFFSSRFDHTEVLSIFVIGAVIGGAEGAVQLLRLVRHK